MQRRHAFTLIEMLLVVSIIVLLIALLLPSLRSARDSARAAQCLAILHANSTGFLGYAYDNQSLLFPMSHGVGEYWHSRLLPYFGGNPDSLLCPAAMRPPTSSPAPFNSAWGPGGGFLDNKSGSYGLNLWFIPHGDFANDASITVTRIDYFFSTRQDDAARIPVFADARWVGGWPDDQDIFPTDVTFGWQQHAQGYFMGRFCGDRHQMAVNVGFLDGRADRIPLRELWQLKWHKNFEVGEPK